MIKLITIKRAKENYKNNKEILREKSRNKYRNLSEEEKEMKRGFGKNRYKNMSEENKQRLNEYQKNFRKATNKHKNLLSLFIA